MKQQDQTKKYIPLGQVSRKNFNLRFDPKVQQTSTATERLSASFYIPEIEPKKFHPNPLPDIYTTCPELRQFKPVLDLPSVLAIDTPEESIPINTPQIPVPQKLTAKESSLTPPPSSDECSFDPEAPILHPHELGFVPQSEWPMQCFSLWDLRSMYFTRRNGAAQQFNFKLYNALCITMKYPEAYRYVGAIWVTQTIMKIHSHIFANLLGIHAVQGGLFHKQGNFSRHGFTHVYKQSTMNLQKCPLCDDVDDYNVRLLQDRMNRFCRGCMYRYGF